MKYAIIATHPNVPTGYANIASNLCNELVKHHDVIYLGFQNNINININRNINSDIKVFDLYDIDNESPQRFGDKAIVPILKIENPDVVIIYNDHGVCSSVLKIIKDIKCKKWCYLDLVYEYQYSENINYIRDNCDKILTFTDSWKSHLNKVYKIKNEQMYTLYHGVDKMITNMTKQSLGFKEDDFIILSLNRNDSRKNIDIVISSFLTYFKECEKRDSLYLFINCHLNTEGGINILQYLDILSIELDLDIETIKKHIRTPPNVGTITDKYIHGLYNTCDAGISITSGEGFGLTVIEHLQYNKPVICSRIPVFEELLGTDYKFFINPVTKGHCYNNLGGYKYYFRREDCVDCLRNICFQKDLIDSTDYIKQKFNWENLIVDMIKKN